MRQVYIIVGAKNCRSLFPKLCVLSISIRIMIQVALVSVVARHLRSQYLSKLTWWVYRWFGRASWNVCFVVGLTALTHMCKATFTALNLQSCFGCFIKRLKTKEKKWMNAPFHNTSSCVKHPKGHERGILSVCYVKNLLNLFLHT